MKTFLTSLFFSFTLFMLAACGGSGGSADNSSGNSTSSFGFVTVSVGDNDISEFDQAIFVITEVALLGDAEQVVLLDEQRTIDFLALETVNEILAETEVPVGTYSKVRLAVDSIDLIKLDDNGDVEETVAVRLVANGKVDIVPRGEFTVAPDSTLALDIDIDLEKSIKLTTTGNGRYIFRPVIFADIIANVRDGRVVRVEGEFEFIDIDGVRQDDRFRICAAELMSDNDDVVESQLCRLVLADEAIGVFDAVDQLTATTLDALQNGDNVVVYGLLQPDAYEPDSTDHYGTPIAALVAAKGEFSRLEGVAASSFDTGTETFDIDLEPGQGIVGDLILSTYLPLTEGAILIDKYGSPYESSVLESGIDVEVEGLLSLGEMNSVEAFVAIIDAEPEQQVITGMATAIDLVSRTLTLTDGDTIYCVNITDDTDIQMLESDAEGVLIDTVSLDALLNSQLEVTGAFDSDSGCMLAEAIILDMSSVL